MSPAKKIPINCVCVILALFTLVSFSTAQTHSSDSLEAQSRLENLALDVFDMPAVRQQRSVSKKIYQSDPVADTEAGRATLRAALSSISMAMVQWAVNDDASRPELMWVTLAAHTAFGHAFPNSGYGIENPDNVYRHAPVDGHSRYEIRGMLPANPPAQTSFTLYSTLPGTGAMNREGSMILGALDQLVVAPDRSFVVTIDRDPANGRPNHIQSADQTALLIVRDSLTDWTAQSPVDLSIHRVAGPDIEPAHDQDAMARRAAWLIERTVPFWADYNRSLVYTKPVNTVLAPKKRGGGWGFGLSGHFQVGSDEALVVTLDPVGAGYLGFQLADPWGVGLEYVHRSGSLNTSQIRSNEDGTISYVVAAQEPGVHNWLDTGGLDRGIFAIRWQGVPQTVTTSDGMVRDFRVVPLAALKELLPEPIQWRSAEQRARQLSERAQSYQRRFPK